MPPSISNTSVLVAADTSALITFTTDNPTTAYIEYGLTASYGSQTINDLVRFYSEQAIPITGLVANTTYHYRIVATDPSGTTMSNDATFTTATDGENTPNLPTQVDTRMPDMSGATEQTVKNSGGNWTPSQFQQALDAARDATGKRIITVDAGITLPAGQYTLGNKVDSNWIIVRSSAHTSLPEGKRVTTSQTTLMFKIQNTNIDPPLITATSAHHWRFIGAEITIDPASIADAPAGPSQNGLVRIGTGSETLESQLPHDIIFDRCYIHGQPLKNTTRGVYGNGTDWAVIDSYLSEFHNTGADAQAVLSGSSQRVKILNNTLESAGECFMSGGTGVTVVPAFTPSDFEFSRNYVTWKQSWKSNDPSWDGKDWVTKNHWESKMSIRDLVFANVFNMWWSSEQTGGSVAIKSSNDDKNPVVVSRDIVWLKNHHTNLGGGIVINGSSWPDEESTDFTRNVWFVQNLFEINGDVWDNEDSGDSSPADVSSISYSVVDEGGGSFRKQYPDDFRLIHNTFTNAIASESSRRIHAFSEVPTSAGKSENFRVQDNIFGYGIFGIKCDGTAEGNASLDAITNSASRTWTTNLVAGDSTNYPVSNTYVANFTAVKFMDLGNGLGGNYRLASDSPGKNAASDGSDIGVDVDAVERATEFCVTGDWLTTPTTIAIQGNVSFTGKVIIS